MFLFLHGWIQSCKSIDALHSTVMCHLVLEKIDGSQWSCSNRRSNKTYWSCFYPSCNFNFSSFSFVVGSSTASTLSSHYAGLYSYFWFCFRSTGQVPPNAAATIANQILLRRHITPKWKLLMINFRFIPRIAYAGQGGFDWQWTQAEIPTDHVPIFYYMKMSTPTIKQQNFIGTTVVNMLRIDKTAATSSRHQCHRMEETKGFGRVDLKQVLVIRHVSLLLFWIVIRNKICDY